jgi:cobalamin biosynthesis protein CbiD
LGADSATINAIFQETTAEATVKIFRERGLMEIFDHIAQQVVSKTNEFVGDELKLSCIILSLGGEVLGSHPRGKDRRE